MAIRLHVIDIACFNRFFVCFVNARSIKLSSNGRKKLAVRSDRVESPIK